MPLDVKPLSPARRVLLIVAMLGLLALALGFAQLLVNRQRLVVIVKFDTPQGADGCCW